MQYCKVMQLNAARICNDGNYAQKLISHQTAMLIFTVSQAVAEQTARGWSELREIGVGYRVCVRARMCVCVRERDNKFSEYVKRENILTA
jgi:hypothetical protein